MWVGSSDDLRLAFQSSTWSEVHDDINDIYTVIIEDSYEDGELEDWLEEYNLTMTGDYVHKQTEIEVPYSLEIVKSAVDLRK